jgi:S-adenosylmethionine hydrolase
MRAAASIRPIITLTSDFGLSDIYVAAMKAVLLQHCPSATLIDITHNVPRQDILCGSITLERAIDGFPPGTTHLAVVDPGVGTHRRLLVAKIKGATIVCPDNGLITWAWRLHRSPAARDLTWRPARFSNTFHGRDIMAPVAGMLAAGKPIEALTRPMEDPILLNIAPTPDPHQGEVIHIDHFGNATTNIAAELLKAATKCSVRVHRRNIGKLKRTYWDVAPGKPIALIGSSGLLEIAVRDGSAAQGLKIRVGDAVRLA